MVVWGRLAASGPRDWLKLLETENPEGKCPAINLCPEAQVYLGYAAGLCSETKQQVHH